MTSSERQCAGALSAMVVGPTVRAVRVLPVRCGRAPNCERRALAPAREGNAQR